MSRFLFWIIKGLSVADLESAIERLCAERVLQIAPSDPSLPGATDIAAGFNNEKQLLTLYVGDSTGLNLDLLKYFSGVDREYVELCYFDKGNYWVCNLHHGEKTLDKF